MKENYRLFIDNIYEATLNGTITWTYDKSYLFNSDTKFSFLSILSDGNTKCRMEIDTLSSNYNSLVVENGGFKSGFLILSDSDYPRVKSIREYIFKNEFSKIKILNKDELLIGSLMQLPELIQSKRDSILSELLEEEEKPVKKSFWSRFF